MDESLDFVRGPYGEIFPPPLVGGLDPEEALAQFLDLTAAAGHPVNHLPTRGESRKGLINLAMLYHHQLNLKRALSGEWDDPDALRLRQAVLDGEPLSLRPLGLETLHFSTFAPILQWIGGRRWRVGQADAGRSMVLEGEIGAALEQAWELYRQWSEEERDRFDASTDRLLSGPENLNHLYGRTCILQGEAVIPAAGVKVERLNHYLYRLTTPLGQRLFTTSTHERALRVGEALAERLGLKIRYPEPLELQTGLRRLFDTPPTCTPKGIWTLGPVQAVWAPEGKRWAVLELEKARYFLIQQSGELQVIPAPPTKGRAVATSTLLPHQLPWLETATGNPLYQEIFLAYAAVRIAEYHHERELRQARHTHTMKGIHIHDDHDHGHEHESAH